jgi:tRNA (guanine-N7-)-methyltransferase
MAQKKLMRFAEVATFPNVLQYPLDMQGKWNTFFENDNPITLELACGKGEYAVGLGRLHPQRNFLGIDLKGNRIWVGARKALNEGLKNVGFVRSHIDKIENYFAPGEVSEIWITFPDPQLRVSKARKRLTHPQFLRIYKSILKPGGFIHLKTDSPDLYDFTKLVALMYGVSIVEDMEDAYANQEISDDLKIKTYYESLDIARSNRVHYLKFTLPAELRIEKDEELKALLREEQIG